MGACSCSWMCVMGVWRLGQSLIAGKTVKGDWHNCLLLVDHFVFLGIAIHILKCHDGRVIIILIAVLGVAVRRI